MGGILNRESSGTKSGWCCFPLHDTKQHKGCKGRFEVRGYKTWDCICECHKGSATVDTSTVEMPQTITDSIKPKKKLTRAEMTKGV